MKKSVVRLFRILLPGKVWSGVKKIANKVLLFTWSDLYFYYDADYARGALQNVVWTEKFCRVVREIFKPSSVIDFGCNIGVILHDFEKNGIDILGVDGSRAAKKYSLIDKKRFLLFDLRRRLSIAKAYDLCFCLEVAEHIEERYSDVLISNIAGASSNVIFSSAPPPQVADCHFNLKPHEWWIEKFKKFGFVLDLQATKAFKKSIISIPGIPYYYVDNIMIFRRMISSRQAKEDK